MARGVIAVIGGSGVYEIDGLEKAERVAVKSPFGAPSDEILTGEIGGVRMAFLPRHGRGHPLSPSDINYRANIDALKRLGATDVISLSACGSFREELAPGDFVLVDQFIDRTRNRASSFFGPGCVAHVGLAHPVCPRISDTLAQAATGLDVTVHRGGVYLCMEGPQFSTLAESRLYRDVWGCHVIGMTNMPEAKLAREAELCYASVAMVTDYDCWHPDHDAVDVESIVRVLRQNAANGVALAIAAAQRLGAEDAPEVCPHGCDRALDTALITAPEARSPEKLAELDAVAGRVLG